MYLTVKQQVNQLSKEQYLTLRKLSHYAKNLANEAIYNIRQYYFTERKYLSYESNYHLLKTSDNYKQLNSNMAQQILKEVDGMFKSFFSLLKLAKKGKYSYQHIKLPRYLPKDGFMTLIIGMVRLNQNKLTIPMSNAFRKTHDKIEIKIPPQLVAKKIKEIRIVPKNKARFFEIQYTYIEDEKDMKLNKNNALGIDLGLNNLATCVTNTGDSFIMDGKKLKSINQWFNKRNKFLQKLYRKQGYSEHFVSERQYKMQRKRNRQVNDILSKSAKYIIDYCIQNDIGTLVVGYNVTLQSGTRLGRRNNQNFVNIPLGKLRQKLEYLCQLNNIDYIEQEESYTSKASFFDNDEIPMYNKDNPQNYVFSGKRIKRGLYKTSSGYCFNADCNGALNILKKSSVVDISILYSRGEVNTPERIRVV